MSGVDTSLPASDLAAMQLRQSTAKTADATLKAGQAKMDPAQIKKAATDFEAVFATEMLSHMFEGIGADKMFGGGNGEEVFKSLMIDQYGHAIARTGALGIADKVAAELIKAQER